MLQVGVVVVLTRSWFDLQFLFGVFACCCILRCFLKLKWQWVKGSHFSKFYSVSLQATQMLGESVRSTFHGSLCRTWAKTLEWMCLRKVMWTPSTPQGSFAALSLFTVSLLVSPIWKWTLADPLNTRCSTVTLLAWVWALLVYHLASPFRRKMGLVWWATPTLHACLPLVSAGWVEVVVEVEEGEPVSG